MDYMEYVKKIFKKTEGISLLISIVFAIIGIILIINPEGMMQAISYILGIGCILAGIYKIIETATNKISGNLYSNDMVYGIMAIIVGIIVMVFSGTIGAIFRIIIGVWIIYTSLINIISALKLKDINSKNWIPTLVIAILMLICGLYVIVTSGAIVATVGVFILIYSIMDIIETLVLLKDLK